MGLVSLNLTPKVLLPLNKLLYLANKYMKNLKLLFLFLVIILVSTQAAPKGRGGGRGYRGGTGGYYYIGSGGGGSDGELPTWAVVLLCFFSIGIIAGCLYACCSELDNDNETSEHENKVTNEH